MSRILIHNIGEFFTGDLAQPVAPVSSLSIDHGVIEALNPAEDRGFEHIIDAAGCAVVPGLIDGHVHPVLGQWTPTQEASGWIRHYLHGGTTTMLSACELHAPGLDYKNLTPDLVTALALVTAATYGSQRWDGVKVYAGTVILVPGMHEAQFATLAQAGAKVVKFIFFPLEERRAEAQQYVAWARAHGLVSKVHTGGVSRSGYSQVCGYPTLAWLQPDIAAHISGGPIPMPDEDIDRVIDDCSFPLEICSSGNYAAGLRAVRRLTDSGQLARLTLGSDTPGGTGVIPRGMWRNILFLSSICGLSPGEAIAVATGNTARAHGLGNLGVLAPGYAADLLICGAVEGSAQTLAEAVQHGDLPGISTVITAGNIVVRGQSLQTPPPRLRPLMRCCDTQLPTARN